MEVDNVDRRYDGSGYSVDVLRKSNIITCISKIYAPK